MLKSDIEEIKLAKFIEFVILGEDADAVIKIPLIPRAEPENKNMILLIGGDNNVIYNPFSSLIFSKQDCLKLANFILEKCKE